MPRDRKRQGSTIVYSTDADARCRQCLRPLAACVCAGAAPRGAKDPGDGVVRLARETKGRKGGGVTLIDGVPLAGAELAALATRLKRLFGVGGTVHDGVIELQTDQRARLQIELEKLGWKVKLAGG